MSIKIKNAVEIEKMRVAGRLAAEVLEMIEPHVKAGVTTEELDQIFILVRSNVLRYCVMATSLISILRLSKTATTAIPQKCF